MDDPPKDLFRTRDHVADFDLYVAQYAQRSAETRGQNACRLDLAYGDGPGETLDLFFPGEMTGPRPIHLFVHGGYWRMFGKADFSFIADTVVAAGGIAAIMDYALMPAVRMETVVAQVRQAAAWLVRSATDFGGDPARLSISGHSAGAHLCCSLLQEDSPVKPRAALLLSGIYDLVPLQKSFLQPLIGLTDAEVERFSPVTARYGSSAEVKVVVGSEETAPFHEQAARLLPRLEAAGTAASKIELPGGNHMSVVLDLGTPGTAAATMLARLIQHD